MLFSHSVAFLFALRLEINVANITHRSYLWNLFFGGQNLFLFYLSVKAGVISEGKAMFYGISHVFPLQ
uniref:Uncharacterized protein n=1 Tax=Octopus bimaculoides TaxID=37653 RepID=A0A0L8HTX9_OCTBM